MDAAHRLGETRTALCVESSPGASDDHLLEVNVGSIAAFHGSVCSHCR